MEKEYNREILRIFGQILLVIMFVVGTYFIFTGSRLSSYAAIANSYGNANYDLQVLYGKDDLTNKDVNMLDKGVLQLRNPNNHAVTANVNFIISDYVDLNSIDVIINGEKIDKTNYTVNDGYYIFMKKLNMIQLLLEIRILLLHFIIIMMLLKVSIVRNFFV